MAESSELRLGRSSRKIVAHIVQPENRPFYGVEVIDEGFPPSRFYYVVNKLLERGILETVPPPEGCDAFAERAMHYDLAEGAEEKLSQIQPTRLEQLVGRLASVIR